MQYNQFTLKDLLEIKNGTDYRNVEVGSVPVYGSGGYMASINKWLYDGESILLPRKGTLNNIMFVRGKFWTVDTMYWSVIDKQKVIPYYLYNYLKALNFDNLYTGSTLPSMTNSAYYSIPINLPSLDNQKKLGHILEIIDKKIDINNKISTELEKVAKTLYEYWFVQFDFPDENERPYKSSGGTMVYNEILKREIPIGWEVIALSDIANITMGQSPSGSSYNTTGQGMPFHQGCANFGDKFPIAEQYTTEPSRMANVGDFLVSVRAPVGSLNIAIEKCCIGRGLAAINSKTNDNEYLYQILQNFKNQFELRNSTGTTFGSITKDDLFSLLVIKPKDNVLESYKQICQSLSQEQYNLFLENYKLTKIRDYLLPMLMNGQISITAE